MARVTSLDEAAILALFEQKRSEDVGAFGSRDDVENAKADILLQGIQIANNHSDIVAAQASIASHGATLTSQATLITETRPVVCTSTTRPTANLYIGKPIWESDTKAFGRWNGTVWVMNDTVAQVYTPALTPQAGSFSFGSGSAQNGKFKRYDGFVHVWGTIFTGTTGFAGGTGPLGIQLPVAKIASEVPSFGVGLINAWGGDYNAVARVDPPQDQLYLYLDYLDTSARPNAISSSRMQNTDPGAAIGTGIPRIPGQHTFTPTNPGYINWDIHYQYI